MQTVFTEKKHAGKSIERVIREFFPDLSQNALYKALRKRDVKVNGIRIKEGYSVNAGDRLDIYIADDYLKPDGKDLAAETGNTSGFSVVYEDENILIVNKKQGVPVHSDRDQNSDTLIDQVTRYLSRNNSPSLCHRIDRNTGGLVIISKNEESLKILLEKIKNKEIQKFYQCLVKGEMPKHQETLTAYLTKDENKSRVFISDSKTAGALEIITRYKVLSYDADQDISRLEVELITGRTHQIRAHLAYIGHPIIGDGKYGTNAINKPLKAKQQALWACKLVFNLKQAGHLNYLKGATFEVDPQF